MSGPDKWRWIELNPLIVLRHFYKFRKIAVLSMTILPPPSSLSTNFHRHLHSPSNTTMSAPQPVNPLYLGSSRSEKETTSALKAFWNQQVVNPEYRADNLM